jgi:hypothetical protein
MDERPTDTEPAYHLLLSHEELPLLSTALRLLISDEAHQSQIRQLARAVLAELELASEREHEAVHSVALSPQQMKITYTALHLLLDDLQREQADEIRQLQGILAKLPDEHAIRAITLD